MKTKEIKGITLISLAVTIVVLLILAGISINTVVGDNGIIKKTQSSAELTKESEAKEIINRTIMEFYLTNEYETLEDFLNTKVSASAPALSKAFAVSYSQFVPGNTGINTFGRATLCLHT